MVRIVGTYPVEEGIIRTLDAVDPELAAEIASQDEALSIYLDEQSLMSRYERTVARIAVEELLPTRTGAILDAGCGPGLIGRLYPDLDLYALDVSFTLLKQATTGYQLRVEGSAEALPFEDGSFDHVLAINMLHHVIHPERAVAEFTRVLKPGGTLIAIDPRKVAPIELAKRILRRHDPAFAPTHKAFSVAEYEQLAAALRPDTLRSFGLVTLLAAGGLDQLKLSPLLPAHDRVLSTLMSVDAALEKLPLLSNAGLYLAIRGHAPA